MNSTLTTRRLTLCALLGLLLTGAAASPPPAEAAQKQVIGVKWTFIQYWRAPNGKTVSTSMIFYNINSNPKVLQNDRATWARHVRDMQIRGYWALTSKEVNYLYIWQ